MADYTVPLLIDGKEITTPTTFDVTSPNNGEKIWKSSSASKEDALSAVAAAQKAQPAWAKTKPSARRDIFLKAADLLEKKRDESFKYTNDETGAAPPFFHVIYTATVEMLRDVGGRINESLQGEIPTCGQEGTGALILKEPYGVIFSIAPWNAPFVLGMRSIVYPVAAGNTVVFKGSELSPRSFWVLGHVLTEAGLPPGVLNIIYHRPQDAAEITEAIIAHHAIKKVNFTGSTAIGSIIASLSGKYLKPVLMELGGKASAIVCDDANVETAARECTLGAFLNTGQICMSTERILVQSKILPAFRGALQQTISAIFPAVNASVTVIPAAVEKNKRLVADAVSKGAKIIHGDPSAEESINTRLAPIVVEGVKKGMDLYYTESFGPTVSLIPFETEEEALEIANDTDYGLSGAVFTENLGRGLRIAKQIETGAVHINSMTVHDEPNLPHGGAKTSGWGRFNASMGLAEFLRVKVITYQE